MANPIGPYNQVGQYLRLGPFKDLEYCRFVDEEFRGHALNTASEWREQYTNAGAGSFIDDVACGVYQMLTDNNINDSGILDRSNIRIVDPSLFPLLCIRARVPDIADVNIEMRLGLVDVFDTDHCLFEVDRSAHGNFAIYAEAYNGGAQTQNTHTNIYLDDGWHIYEIYIDSAGKPVWYIDGVLADTGDDADIDPAEFFQPHAEIFTENADVKTLDLDFIKGLQKRE